MCMTTPFLLKERYLRAHKTGLIPLLFIGVPVPSQETDRSFDMSIRFWNSFFLLSFYYFKLK